MPELILLGGPNGVGKSTLSDTFYAPNGFEIINGDRILFELSGAKHLNTDLSVLADQEIKRRIKDFLASHKSFVVESNLNIPSSYNVINVAKNKKFITRLKYLGVDKLDLLNQRIAERVLRGLHNVEPSIVIQKYNDSLRILPKMITSFDDCELIDNSKEHQAGILMLSFN